MGRRLAFPELDPRVPLFSSLTREQRARIARASTEVTLPPGYRIVSEGSASNDVYVLMSGTVDVTRDGERLATLGSGDFFGETAALTKARRNATVTTTDSVRLLHIDGRVVASVVAANERVAADVAPTMSQRRLETSLAA